MPVAHRLVRAVEVLQVLLDDPVGREVGAAAEPPLAGDAVPLGRLEVAVLVGLVGLGLGV